MKKQPLFLLIATFMLVTACALGSQSAAPEAAGVPTVPGPASAAASPAPPPSATLSPLEPASPPGATAAADCLAGETSPVGEAIAEGYETATYEQVMEWFCAGAEYEDILVALETEAQSGVSAGELLTMLAEGLSWDQVWEAIGLVD